MKKNLIVILFLLIIPFLLVFYRISVDKPWYSSDPEYGYILNGLNLYSASLPYYFDHPGVPLTMINAVLLYPIYLFSGHQSVFSTDIIVNPLYYELRLHTIIFIMILLVTFLSGIVLWKMTRNIALAILLQGLPFYYSLSVDVTATRMMPETLFPIVIYAFIILIASLIKNPANRKALFLLPVISGLALSIKVIIFPLLLIPALMYAKSIRKFATFCVLSGVSFVLFSLPIIKQFPRMGYWFFKLFIYSGKYGEGDASVINTKLYLENFKHIIFEDVLITGCLGISLIIAIVLLFIRLKRPGFISPLIIKLFFLVFVAIWLNLIVLSKSYESSKGYYLIIYSNLVMSAVIIFAVIAGKYVSNLYQKIGVIAFIVITILINRSKYYNSIIGWDKTRKEQTEVNDFMKNKPEAVFIFHKGYSLNKMNALLFGSNFSKIHQPLIDSIYPNSYFFNVISGKFSIWNRQKNIIPVIMIKETYMVDFGLQQDEIRKLSNLGIHPKIIMHNRSKVLYQLMLDTSVFDDNVRIKYKRFRNIILKSPEKMAYVKEFSEMKKISIDSAVSLGAVWYMQ
jgi:hypothetical protein